MAFSESIATFATDQLEGLGSIRTKKMFGALAFYCDDTLFAAVMDDAFTLKAKDEDLQQEFVEQGFTRHKLDGRDIKMPYFDVTPTVLEDSDELKIWAAKSLNAVKK